MKLLIYKCSHGFQVSRCCSDETFRHFHKGANGEISCYQNTPDEVKQTPPCYAVFRGVDELLKILRLKQLNNISWWFISAS